MNDDLLTGDPVFDAVAVSAEPNQDINYWKVWVLVDPLRISEAARLLAGLNPEMPRNGLDRNLGKAVDAGAYITAMIRAVQSGRLHAASPLAWFQNGYDGEAVACDPASDELCAGTTVTVAELRRWAELGGIQHRWPDACDGQQQPMPARDLSSYPAELRAAIEAFEAVHADPKATAGKSAKQALREWLDANKPELSGEARGRLSTVANWQKDGGAPKTPGE